MDDEIQTDVFESMELPQDIEEDYMEDCEDEDLERWSSSKVQYLLSLYLERKNKFRNPKIKKKNLWREMAEKLHLSEEACNKKFRNLKGTFIKLLKKKKKSGREAVTWKFFNIFEEIFENDQNVNPTIKRIDTLAELRSIEVRVATPVGTETTTEGRPSVVNVERQPHNSMNILPVPDGEVPAVTPSAATTATPTQSGSTATTAVRERRFEAYRKLTKEIRDRQIVLERKIDNITEVLTEANTIQRERNEILKDYLEKK